MIERVIKSSLLAQWDSGKVLIVTGPRQAGKTTLLRNICDEKGPYLFINGDDPEVKALFDQAGENKLRQIIGKYTTVFIDEAQRIPDIGIIAKIIHDRLDNVRLIISGSSALEISSAINEPLTGRKWEYFLYPVSWQELVDYLGYPDARKQLEQRIIFGMYPEIIVGNNDPQMLIKSLAGSYLYKDLLQYEGIRKPELLDKLLVALALQIGSEVNYNELSSLLRVDRNTIERYIDLLEKAFVVFRLSPLSRNLRNELNTGRKIYFFDNGIRNALIGDFKAIDARTDKGALWENFIMSERLKRNANTAWYGRSYFWRTYQQQEIDLIEEIDGEFHAFEFKWNRNAKAKFSKTFVDNYKPAKTICITPNNFEEILLN
ncbi:MAG: ATP-binding protein [Cyclobacteriaceae bacterium]|nr:ATP-binding protein [Cyclobacteriaceae bacterium]